MPLGYWVYPEKAVKSLRVGLMRIQIFSRLLLFNGLIINKAKT